MTKLLPVNLSYFNMRWKLKAKNMIFKNRHRQDLNLWPRDISSDPIDHRIPVLNWMFLKAIQFYVSLVLAHAHKRSANHVSCILVVKLMVKCTRNKAKSIALFEFFWNWIYLPTMYFQENVCKKPQLKS